ncbi:T-cell-specific guanine nucleotide triphosphate-binding protein 2-like [Liolophura sinensis]|uniref:T-cell-specific guanine nucleotide triphosphate-binding protein 2-like n=1 Tax=Liolophura sinensis TaxID=3198878 RepID=UPI00315814B3
MGQGNSKVRTLDVAVIGKTGSGKSTFINTYADLSEPYSVKTDLIEGTEVITSYYKQRLVPYPPAGNNSTPITYTVRIWDFPGFGTHNYPEDKYIRTVKKQKCDFYLLLSRSRPSGYERKIHNYLAKQGKIYFYVRTGIDRDIVNSRRDHPHMSEEEIKQSILDEIKKNVSTEPEIYLINAKKNDEYDFPKLDKELVPYILEANETKIRFKTIGDTTSSCSIL